jgi:hypothetical protein
MPISVSSILNAGLSGYVGSQGNVGYVGSAGTNGYDGSVGFTGSRGDTGLGFAIAKSYGNVAALTADTSPTGIVAGQFAIVETGNVEDSENSRLYLWTGSAYNYVTDLSGASGITGPQGGTGYTGSMGLLTNWLKRTANYTAVSGDRIIADTSAGTFNITLPATPTTGAYIKITDGYNFAANSLVVINNGSTIENQAENVNVDIASVDLEFIYDGTTWQIISTSGPIGYTGSIGSTGYTGSVGTGYTGSQGNQGAVGYTGSAPDTQLHPFLFLSGI